MVDVDCESCHDLAKPRTQQALAAQCETCHDKGFGEMLDLWRDEATTGRKQAAAAIAELEKQIGTKRNGAAARLTSLVAELRGALGEVDRAGAVHNPEFAGAIYKRITALAAQPSTTSAQK